MGRKEEKIKLRITIFRIFVFIREDMYIKVSLLVLIDLFLKNRGVRSSNHTYPMYIYIYIRVYIYVCV